MYSVFLSSYTTTRESLGELEKAVETLASVRLVFPQHFSFSQNSTRVCITREKHGTCFLFLKYYEADKCTLCLFLKQGNVGRGHSHATGGDYIIAIGWT